MKTTDILNLREEFIKKLLYIIVKNKNIADELIFKGGTSLSLFYGLDRFSEDLDFNYQNLDIRDIEKVLIENNYMYKKTKTINSDRLMVKYEVDNIQYDCIIDLVKYKYKTKPEYDIKTILGKFVKVLSMPQNFSHKLCAYHERKKGRDMIDINFYLSKGIIPDKNILKERKIENFSFFIKELFTDINRPSTNNRLKRALTNLSYNKLDITGFKNELVDNLNKNYLGKDKFDFNINYKDELSGKEIISISKDYTLLLNGKNINPKIKYKYVFLNTKNGNIEHECNKEDLVFKFVNEKIIGDQLKSLDSINGKKNRIINNYKL